MKGGKQHITLQLDSHKLAFDIVPCYRQAAQQINRYFQIYQKQMPRATTELLWAYVALQMAVNLYDDDREKSLQPIEEKLEELNQLILQNIQQTI